MRPIPSELKSLAALAARANELEGVEPAIAYWARFWLVQKVVGQQQHERSDEVEAYLVNVLEQLESTKEKYQGMADIEDRNVGKETVRNFALQVFNNADREERSGHATRQTATKFLAAATFLEICQVFGESEKDIVDKRKYAKVQAMRIQSAIVAGKDPNRRKVADTSTGQSDMNTTPAEHAELEALMQGISRTEVSATHGSTSSEIDARQPSSTEPDDQGPTLQSGVSKVSQTQLENDYFPILSGTGPDRTDNDVDSGSVEDHIAPYIQSKASDESALVPEFIPLSTEIAADDVNTRPSVLERFEKTGFKPDSNAMEACQKHAKWAISALNYEDVDTAILELKRALQALGQ